MFERINQEKSEEFAGGEGINYNKCEKVIKNNKRRVVEMNRFLKMKQSLLGVQRQISIERARYYTESHRETVGEATIIRRAKATAHILDSVEISLRDGESLAGNRTVKPRSGIISPEMSPYWIYEERNTLGTRPQDPFVFLDADRKEFEENIYPYWKGRSLKDEIEGLIPEHVQAARDTKIVKLNQTDKGQGHIIPDFERAMNLGIVGLLEEVEGQSPQTETHQAMSITLRATSRHILRYGEWIEREKIKESDPKRAEELEELRHMVVRMATEAPQSFYEAVQLFWFLNLALQYESNASSISCGRFDQYMFPFLQEDLKSGVPEGELKDVLRMLWIKMNDVVLLRSQESAKYFAGFPTGYTIILGGVDTEGCDAVNLLSEWILDTYADIKLPQPNLGVRVNERTPDRFFKKTAETIRLGTGIPQVFNDEVIIPGFLNRGISLSDARDYAVVGCVELSLPGRLYGLHDIALFNLVKVLEVVLHEQSSKITSYRCLVDTIKATISEYIQRMVEGSNVVDGAHAKFAPIPLLSSLMEECVETSKDVTAGGMKYNFSGVQGIGTANLSDALYAIKQVVYEEKQMSLEDLSRILASDYEDEEIFRHRLIHRYKKFGNDQEEVDTIGAEMLRFYCQEVVKYKNSRGGHFMPGSYTVSAHVPLGQAVGATSDGRKAREQLADGGLSPMVGRDKEGPTAVLKSVSRLDHVLLTNGSLLNVKFHPATLEGEAGIRRMVGYLKAYMRLKIQHIQFNIVSAETLRDAQAHPERYSDLVIRVAGYSAIFVELNKRIQEDIIARTEHQL